MLKKNKIILLLVFLASISFAQKNVFFEYQNRINFAKHLFHEQDFVRAFDEFAALSNSTANDSLKLWAAISLRKLNRFKEAEIHFKSLFDFSQVEDEAKVEYFHTLFNEQDYLRFENSFSNNNLHPIKYRADLLQLKYFSYLFLDKKLPDSTSFINSFPQDSHSDISSFYTQKKYRMKKDIWIAGILSTIIPGSGKIYTKNFSDAAVSFIFTSLFYGLAIHNFSKDNIWSGIILAGIGVYFHAGSVYGSAVAAQHYNAQQKFEYELQLKKYAEKHNNFLPNFEPK